MKCPKCGNELKLSKKDPSYALCHNCRKKFKLPENIRPVESVSRQNDTPVLDDEMNEQTQVFSRREVQAALRKANAERKAAKAAARAASKASASPAKPEADNTDDEEYHFRYANIPPKEIREKQEREMRKAYDELLSIGKEERSAKKRGLFGRKK